MKDQVWNIGTLRTRKCKHTQTHMNAHTHALLHILRAYGHSSSPSESWHDTETTGRKTSSPKTEKPCDIPQTKTVKSAEVFNVI